MIVLNFYGLTGVLVPYVHGTEENPSCSAVGPLWKNVRQAFRKQHD